MEMQGEQSDRTGRRALFKNAGSGPEKKQLISLAEVEENIGRLASIDDDVPTDLPDIYKPLINTLSRLINSIQEQNGEIFQLNEQYTSLENDLAGLKETQEGYLSELIKSHTEFDRALEIFQYHDLPMVIVEEGGTICDANEAFCSLFSVPRSEITHNHPLLTQYIPDSLNIKAPDGTGYSIITIQPPIVPFDNDATILHILIKSKDSGFKELKTPGKSPVSSSLKKDPALEAFELFPIAAAVIDSYGTIRRTNQAFVKLTGRESSTLHLRDIGSCGFESGLAFSLVNSDESGSFGVSSEVLLPGGEALPVWIQGYRIPSESGESHYLVVVIEQPSEDENQIQPDGRERVPVPAEPVDYSVQCGSGVIRTLLEMSTSPTALYSLDNIIQSVNDGFAEILGLSPSDLIGADISELGIIIPPGSSGPVILDKPLILESPWGRKEFTPLIVPANIPQDLSVLILQSTDEPPGVSSTKPLSDEISSPNQITEPEKIIRPTISLAGVQVPALITDSEGHILEWNNILLSQTGMDSSVLSGASVSEIYSIIPSSGEEAGLPTVSMGDSTCQYLSYPLGDDAGKIVHQFFDISHFEKKINTLNSEIETLNSEIGDLKDVHAEEKSQMRTKADDLARQIDIVEFELAGERYAMDISMVREVVEMLPITPLPKTPPYVVGIINLRGEVTHIVDLGVLLGEGAKKDRSGQKIIIIPSDVTQGEHIGIIVDNVRSVTEIPVRQVTALGDEINAQINTHIKGIIKISNDDLLEKRSSEKDAAQLVIWLDMKEILSGLKGAS